jgi:hypothetical protein
LLLKFCFAAPIQRRELCRFVPLQNLFQCRDRGAMLLVARRPAGFGQGKSRPARPCPE